MRRGVISFILVLAFLFPLMQLAALENQAARSAAATREDALFIQKKNAAELDVKNALRQALAAAEGSERERIAADAAAKLAALESLIEKHCEAYGAKADVWFGVASESEIAATIEKTRAQRAPAKCPDCFDLTAPALDSRGRPALLAEGLIDADALAQDLLETSVKQKSIAKTLYAFADGDSTAKTTLEEKWTALFSKTSVICFRLEAAGSVLETECRGDKKFSAAADRALFDGKRFSEARLTLYFDS